MFTLPLRAPYLPHVSVLPAVARVVVFIVAVLDVFAEAQNMVRTAQKRYPFAEW